ncbi:hypothetical protein LTR85_000044 [Meristemomyces frigidus]|nr:hypothetical protein LTR85_000044 [Meristemomyces frigidus]
MGPRTVAKRAAKVQQRLGAKSAAALTVAAPRYVVRQGTLDQAPSAVRQPVLTQETKPPPPSPPPGSFTHYARVPVPVFLPQQEPRLVTISGRRQRIRSIPTPTKKITTIPVRRAKLRHKATEKDLIKYVRFPIGTIDDLRPILGTGFHSESTARDAVLVAIDTESERVRLLGSTVVEIGVTTLRVRDLLGVPPGDHLDNWVSKMSHHHMVLDHTRRPKERMAGSLFGRSQFLTANDAQASLKIILRTCIVDSNGQSALEQSDAADNEHQPRSSDISPPDLVLVGQSIRSDVTALAGAGICLDIYDPAATGVQFKATFDTADLAHTAIKRGAQIPSARLGPLVKQLGVDPRYLSHNRTIVLGTHNASNDAAYTMMALLSLATQWDELLQPGVLYRARPPAAGGQELGKGEARRTRISMRTQGRPLFGARPWWRRSGRLLGSLLAVVLTGTGVSLLSGAPT